MNRKLFLMLIVMLAALALPANWAAANGVGGPFPIGPAAGEKNEPVADIDGAGNVVVAWTQDGRGYFQRLDATGASLGGPVQVNTDTSESAFVGDVSTDAAGNFVVVWDFYPRARGRCFDAAGAPRGPEFLLEGGGGGAFSPAVEMASDGTFVAVWTEQYYDGDFNYQIVGQRFAADCTPVGDLFRVNNTDTGDQGEPDIAMDAEGNFAVAWVGIDKKWGGIYTRFFTDDATPRGGQSRVNRNQALNQSRPRIGMDAAGNAVIAFESQIKAPAGQLNLDVLLRRYDATGAPLSPPFSPHDPSTDVEYLPRLVVAPGGDFVVMWSYDHDFDRDLWLRFFDADGEAQGAMQPLSTNDEFSEDYSALAVGDGTQLLAVWAQHAVDIQLYGRFLEFGDPPSTATSFSPTNDAHVLEARPNNSYGAAKTMQARDAAKDANTYIKFNVSGLSGTVQSAKLRLWVTDAGPDGGTVYATSPFYQATTDLWLETGLTWANAPEITGSALDVEGKVKARTWIEFDVTQAVIDGLADSGRVSLLITNDSSNLVKYGSKEGGKAPELIVYTE